jgi:hypothetical protein
MYADRHAKCRLFCNSRGKPPSRTSCGCRRLGPGSTRPAHRANCAGRRIKPQRSGLARRTRKGKTGLADRRDRRAYPTPCPQCRNRGRPRASDRVSRPLLLVVAQQAPEQAEYHAAHPETAFSFTDYLQVSPDGENRGTCFQFWQPMGERRHKRGYSVLPNALQVALASSVIGTSTAVASKAALEKAQGFRDLPTAWEWDLWLRLAAQSPVACSWAITATYVPSAETAPSIQQRIAAMDEILSPYENSGVASIRNAAAKGRAQLDCARAELSRPVRRHTQALRGGAWAFAASTQAKAASVSAALNFAGLYGAGK